MKDYEVLKNIITEQKENIYDAYDEGYGHGYEGGLEDAWKCARKILFDPNIPKEILDFLDVNTYCGIIQNYSASEAIQKIREYEVKQKINYNDDFITVCEKIYEHEEKQKQIEKSCKMTNSDTITMLENLKKSNGMSTGYTSGFDECMDKAINALKAIDEIIDYLHDSSVTWRDITDDIIADIINKYMGEQK